MKLNILIQKMNKIALIPFYLSISLWMLVSCSGSNEPGGSELDLKDLNEESLEYKEGDKKKIEPIDSVEVLHLSESQESYRELILPNAHAELAVDRVPQFMDRFGFVTSSKIDFIAGEKVLHVDQWTFRDSLQVQNVMMNWLACFGPNCKTISAFQKAKIFKQNTFIVVGEKQISLVESNVLLPWNKLKDQALVLAGEEKIQYLILQEKGASLRWFRLGSKQDGELIFLEIVK